MKSTRARMGFWGTGVLVLALTGGTTAVALASGGHSGTTTYLPQLGHAVPNGKVAAYEHALGNLCYPAKCPQHPRARPAPPPSGPLAGSPAALIGAGSQIPFSPEMLVFTNGWSVSNGKSVTAVYAGASPTDSGVGRVVILRQSVTSGTQAITIVNVPGSGALTVVRAPAGVAAETSAQHGTLSLTGHDGVHEQLNLATGTVTAS